TATVDSVPLIASSVMSKKLAAGADAILLDVKCGRGAFIATIPEAEALARALVRIGTNAGRETVAYVTDMEQPLGRAVGNALEVKEAIETLAGRGPSDLEALSLRLGAEMLRLAGHPPTDLHRLMTDGSALRKLAELIAAQDGDARVVDNPGLLPSAPVKQPVTALAVGVVLNKKIGDPVKAGELLAVIHARTAEAAANVTYRIAAAFTVASQAQPRALLLRRVTATDIQRLDT